MRTMLRGKIHRAAVTEADLHYEGSIAIDPDLLEKVDMIAWEQVHVFNVNNGERFVTYIIEGKRGSGQIMLNGAAARKVAVGDRVIICSFDEMSNEEAATYKPKKILLNEKNEIVSQS